MVVTVRAANVSDHHFLESMFVEAALWDPGVARQTIASLLRVPQLSPYFVDWGRPSDVALIASAADRSVGAAWYRFFSSHEPGFGFVDESIPELGIAVVKEWRGRSTGTTLLKELISTARTRGCSGL
jgi:GNAT superfamily N-acetyltransferase